MTLLTLRYRFRHRVWLPLRTAWRRLRKRCVWCGGPNAEPHFLYPTMFCRGCTKILRHAENYGRWNVRL